MIIETERLRLRPHQDSDVEDLLALANNWEVAKWLANLPWPYEHEHAEEWIGVVRERHEAGNPLSFAFALKETDKLIGGGGLDGSTGTESTEPALGYWIGEPHQGKGYGREAIAALLGYGFNTLGLSSINAYTDPGNNRSQKLLVACGMKPCGTITLLKPTCSSGATQAPFFTLKRADYI